MVAIIKTGNSIRGMVQYNEQKVRKGVADCIHMENYPMDVSQSTKQERLKMLLNLASRNKNVRRNSVHISLNFAPGEQLAPSDLKNIAREYMDRIGFGEQPYLIYEHRDAGHPHIHIATVKIRHDGSRIETQQIGKNKSEPARKYLEQRYGLVSAEAQGEALFKLQPISVTKLNYGKTETKRAIGNVLQHVLKNYKFTSIPELNAVLQLYHVTADRGAEDSRIYKNKGLVYRVLDEQGNKIGVPIKASSYHFKPTLKAVTSQFVKNELGRQKHLKSTRATIDWVLLQQKGMAIQTFTEALEQQGVGTVLRVNTEGRLYGITYIDHKSRCVFNGSTLGKKYSAKAILESLDKSTESVSERPEKKTAIDNRNTALTQGQVKEKNDLTDSGEQENNQSKGLVETLLTPEESFQYLPFEWRKKKKKKRKKL